MLNFKHLRNSIPELLDVFEDPVQCVDTTSLKLKAVVKELCFGLESEMSPAIYLCILIPAVLRYSLIYLHKDHY